MKKVATVPRWGSPAIGGSGGSGECFEAQTVLQGYPPLPLLVLCEGQEEKDFNR